MAADVGSGKNPGSFAKDVSTIDLQHFHQRTKGYSIFDYCTWHIISHRESSIAFSTTNMWRMKTQLPILLARIQHRRRTLEHT